MVEMAHLFCIIVVHITAEYLVIFSRITQRVQDVIDTLTGAGRGPHDRVLRLGKRQGKKPDWMMKDCCSHHSLLET